MLPANVKQEPSDDGFPSTMPADIKEEPDDARLLLSPPQEPPHLDWSNFRGYTYPPFTVEQSLDTRGSNFGFCYWNFFSDPPRECMAARKPRRKSKKNKKKKVKKPSKMDLASNGFSGGGSSQLRKGTDSATSSVSKSVPQPCCPESLLSETKSEA